MDRVADRANVSKRTIYNHFESKEALFQAITEELVDRIERVTEVPYDPTRSLKAQLEEIGHRKIDLMTCPGFLSLAKVTISELLRNPNLASDTYCRIHREEAGLVRWIRAAAEDGRLEISAPIEAAEQFSALLSAFAFWPLLFGRPAPAKAKLAKIVSSAADMFLAHYGRDKQGDRAHASA
jgi:TetR/AcrR family transcriptional regulator of autoinduction and epiphytic fitness